MRFWFLSVLLLQILLPLRAQADLLSPWRYIKNYQWGLELGDNDDRATIAFDQKSEKNQDQDACVASSNSHSIENPQDVQTTTHCEVQFQRSGNGYGIFLQQPFKRSGFWHFDYDIGLSFRAIDGTMTLQDNQFDADSRWQNPIDDLSLHLFSIVLKPQITFGVTPTHYPELLFSFGPTIDVMWGSINMNSERYQTPAIGLYRRSGLYVDPRFFYYANFQTEVVLRRIGKGWISFSMWTLAGEDHVQYGDLLPTHLQDQDIYDLSLTLRQSFFGLKVVLK